MSRRREHASETGESAARGGAGENAQGQDFPGAAPGRSGGKRRAARLRKSARSPGALSAGAGNGQREDAPWDSPAAAGLPLEFPGRKTRSPEGRVREQCGPHPFTEESWNPRLRSTARSPGTRAPALTLRPPPRHCAAPLREPCHGMAPAPSSALDNFPPAD